MSFETVPASQEQQSAYDEQSAESLPEAIKRLARMHSLEYEKIRESEAEKLGIKRVSELDKAVSSARKRSTEDKQPFDEIEPYCDPIDPAQLLDDITETIRRFIVLDKHQSDIAALWVTSCWFVDRINIAPIALINAPEKSCGKSQLLTVLSKLSPRATQLAGISPSVLFRLIEKYRPTLFIDEIETVLVDNEDLRGLLNAGHTRDSAFVWRSVAAGDDFEPKRFSVWGMKAVAGINAIKLAETVTSRAIVFELRRKKPGEQVERLRHAPEGLFDELKAKLARFAMDYGDAVQLARPCLPSQLSDRQQDNAEPLLQIAAAAGGHWPDKATGAVLEMAAASENSQSTTNELLADIQEVLEESRIEKISTTDLIKALLSDDEKPWATYNRGRPLTPKQLSSRLRSYGVHSKTIRVGFETAKGFDVNQFRDVFDRYLQRTSPVPSVTSSQVNNDAVCRVTDEKRVTVTNHSIGNNEVENVTVGENVTVTQIAKVTRKPAPVLDCDDVTDKNPKIQCVRI